MTGTFEVKKHGLHQLQSGEWTLTVKLHCHDLPDSVMKAPMGQRYGLAMVEIADDETEKQAEPNHRLSRQAAMRCEEPRFWRFLEERSGYGIDVISTPETAANAIRRMCAIDSRAEFDTDDDAASMWTQLAGEYEMWKTA